jgi:hypothetical protein
MTNSMLEYGSTIASISAADLAALADAVASQDAIDFLALVEAA